MIVLDIVTQHIKAHNHNQKLKLAHSNLEGKMVELENFRLFYLLVLIGAVLAAPASNADYADEDDLLDQFLKGIKPDSTPSTSQQNATTNPKLILISFDGFRWDYLDNHTLPNITKYFVEQGVKVNRGLNNVFPTYSFPNLWTLATGLYPESHGVVSSEFLDPKLGAIRNVTDVDSAFNQTNISIPIWILNQLNKTSTPDRRSASLGGFPGAHVEIMNTSVAYSEFHLEDEHWLRRIDRLVELLSAEQAEKINLGVLYFREPDRTGHQFGPNSGEIETVLLKCDALVGYLIRRLNETK